MSDEKAASESENQPSPGRKRRFAGWPARLIGSLQELENAITREHAGYKKALRLGVAVSDMGRTEKATPRIRGVTGISESRNDTRCGLTSSTLITPLLIPAVYTLFHRRSRARKS